jgi:hypothetical protein
MPKVTYILLKTDHLSRKVRIFQKSAHFFAFSHTHFKEKCVTLHRVCAMIGFTSTKHKKKTKIIAE